MTEPATNADPKAARAERLAAALRENLKRRKAQARVKAGTNKPGDTGKTNG